MNKSIAVHPGQEMMAYFSLSGPNILFYMENMLRDLVPLPIIIFYHGERRGKLCLTVVDNKLITMRPGQFMMAKGNGQRLPR